MASTWYLAGLDSGDSSKFPERGFEHLRHAVVIVWRRLLPAARFGERAQIGGRVGHDDWLRSPLEHAQIIPVVADGHGLALADAKLHGETLERGPFTDTERKQIEKGKIARRILGARRFACRGPGTGEQSFL